MNKIVIIGAGYAGMAAAVNAAARTKRRDDVGITLINATETFTERLRMHQVASGEQIADLRIPELLTGTDVVFEHGWVTGIDTAVRIVRVDDERVVEYDTLVYALGAVADTAAVAGVEENAYTLNGPREARMLAGALDALGSGTVAACGSGLTGVEAAAEIAEQHPELAVVLLGRAEPAATLGAKAQTYVRWPTVSWAPPGCRPRRHHHRDQRTQRRPGPDLHRTYRAFPSGVGQREMRPERIVPLRHILRTPHIPDRVLKVRVHLQ